MRRPPLEARVLTTAALCLGFALAVGGVAIQRRGGWVQAQREAERVGALRREDSERCSALRARHLAESGLERALVELRLCLATGREPPRDYQGTLGSSFASGSDDYQVRVVEVTGDVYRLVAIGDVLAATRGVAHHELQARFKVTASAIERLE
ncbi:MAG: hypothetical protein AB7N76_36900 [Planctomycetota bacterium]